MKRESMANEGRPCLLTPSHGPSLIMPKTGREWCPHSEHHELRERKATPSFLDKQVIEDDQADRPLSA
jgi:hypothetical protein